jgi:exopolysaccharide production protein ExoQ
MPPIVALILCVGVVTVLLYIERRRNPESSLALWVPTFSMIICASRPIGRWFKYTSEAGVADIEAGSPLDRLVLGVLIALGLLIVFRRKIDWFRIAKDNFWLILVFVYMGISILWSDIPFVSFKRWFRSTGDVFLALMVLSERVPLQALESVLRRCAYVLVPFSLVLVKYFPQFGRDYGRWSGGEMWTGVTMQKNSLGALCTLSAFLLIWALLREWRSGKLFKMRSQAFADALVLAIAVFLLKGPGSYSATSVGILIVGIAILLLLYRREKLAQYMARHLKAFVVSIALLYLLFYDSVIRIVASTFGRDETLTGRVDIWRPLLDFASRSPLFGTGYGGFYAPGNDELQEIFSSQFILAQAHNGYLAIYVELGMVGLILLGTFILSYCSRVRRELNHSFEWGVFGICLLPMLLLHNYSEVGFLQSSNYFWSIMVFLVIVFSEACLHAKGVRTSTRNSTLSVTEE